MSFGCHARRQFLNNDFYSAFAPRNPKALKIDFVQRPPYFDVSPTHKARTWLLDPRAPKVEPPEHVRKLRERGGVGYV